ncbi:MAG: ABC transporter substrate-binding protein [Dehalococcoidia bacterium]|nr:ABC transporter substrate-binding protein [Dehalococcoidia bacterium]
MTDTSYWTQLRSRAVTRRSVLRGTMAGGVGLAGAALIGCGSGGGKPAAPAGGSSAAVAQNTAEKPVVSDSVIAIQTRDATSLDPGASTVYTIAERVGLVYPRLFASVLENNTDQNSNKLALSYITQAWEAAGGGTQLTFKIKQGVKYHNIAPLSGREFTSEDVKFAINRYATDPKSLFKASFSDISAIETPDKYTVVMKLKAPSRYILAALASETALITPPETADKYKEVAIGPGPFIHEETRQGESGTFKKNPDFIDAAKIYYNRFLFKVITDAAVRNAAMKSGQADFIVGGGGLSATDMKTVEGPTIKSYAAIEQSGSVVSWNGKNPKWKDYRTRVAMSKAFDRQAQIDQTLQKSGKWQGPVPVDFGRYAMTQEEAKAHNTNKYDPAEAKKLWEAAGNPVGLPVEYYFSSNGTLDGVQTELIAKQWETNLGIKITLKTEDYAVFLPKKNTGGYLDMSTNGYGLPNWMDHLFFAYLPGGARNGSLFDNAEVTAMLNDLRGTLDDKQAAEKSRKIQMFILDKHLPIAYRPNGYSFGIYSPKLRNFYPGNHPVGVEWMLGSWKVK